MDFSFILPVGVGINPNGSDVSSPGVGGPTPRLEIWANLATPVFAGGWDEAAGALSTVDWQVGATLGAAGTGVAVSGRNVYAIISGGQPGVDYQMRWIINDTQGNRWMRTALLLVAQTS
jgi:hypothetical protein